jgi:transcription-repair coupling factor (superfamily II helicase)
VALERKKINFVLLLIKSTISMNNSTTILSQLLNGFDAIALGDIIDSSKNSLLYITKDDIACRRFYSHMRFFAPHINIINMPSWDCLPFDSSSPSLGTSAMRINALRNIACANSPSIIITSVNSILQRVQLPAFIENNHMTLQVGDKVSIDDVLSFLQKIEYRRVDVVCEYGEFAVRGGIVDLFPTTTQEPVRLDFFGNNIETIRTFDPQKQTSINNIENITITPVGDVILDDETIAKFKQNYILRFGAKAKNDDLFKNICDKIPHQGFQHWLPLFSELTTIFDYIKNDKLDIAFDYGMEEVINDRFEEINNIHNSRLSKVKEGESNTYRPLDAHQLYLSKEEFYGRVAENKNYHITPFLQDKNGSNNVIDFKNKQVSNFSIHNKTGNKNTFQKVIEYINKNQGKKYIIIACSSVSSMEKLQGVFHDCSFTKTQIIDFYKDKAVDKILVSFCVLHIDHGFVSKDLIIISEQDIMGEKFAKGKKRKISRSKDSNNEIITQASQIEIGDIIVHIDHGVGRFVGLETIEISNNKHDCFLLEYSGGDKLYVPVENMDILSKYGSEGVLDKLGAVGWQTRKAKLKKKLMEMAGELIKIAAKRQLQRTSVIEFDTESYADFASQFGFEETQDQQNSIDDILHDLSKNTPMDRLVCGDVGFGKTEVAMRACFCVAMSGKQVALICPTTLLARQHYHNFKKRFENFPLKIKMLSRMVTGKDATSVRKSIQDGTCDIIIGTHALLGNSISYNNLGLLVVDEEQHFGVAHKEKIKTLKSNVHILTLSATPIPRTLNLALSGVRDLSIIASPPVDRLAIRTFVSIFDPLVVRETIMREYHRGGQIFYVCPRVKDIESIKNFLVESVPEISFCVGHGQMPPDELDNVMNDFYDNKFNLLLSTTIIESGLDVSNANTMIVHRSDMFGLSQLYQLRGRVGRSSTRGYALFTTRYHKLSKNATKRLKVIQSIDALGAGFSIASHDLDIRGAGNLLGDQQSGHIKEVGFELYQSMLSDAIKSLKNDDKSLQQEYSPKISMQTSVMIPEEYIKDLQLRMNLYRRISCLRDEQIDDFASEMVDRFGVMPKEMLALLNVTKIKNACLVANIEFVETGPKGILIGFHENQFKNPQGLVELITTIMLKGDGAKIRPDHKLVISKTFKNQKQKIDEVLSLTLKLAELSVL